MSIYDRSNEPVLHRPLEPGQYTSIRYGDRLAELGATPSIGTVGDCLLFGYSSIEDRGRVLICWGGCLHRGVVSVTDVSHGERFVAAA